MLPTTPQAIASPKLNSPFAARYPAGGITSSLGSGRNEDSMAIKITIPGYPRSRNRSSSQWMKLSSIEAVLSDEGNEAGLAQRNLPRAGVVPLHEGEGLRAARADRDQEPAPRRELLDQGARDLGASRRDQDGIVGRVRAPPQRPVAVQHRHVRRTRLAHRLLGGAGQALDPFHREHRGGERAQQRGLVPRSRADL